ncbi:MAG: methyltransferase family protein [Mycobacterium sp.]
MTGTDTSRLGRFLARPWVDKTFATLACLPVAYAVYLRLRQESLDIVQINLILQAVLNIVTMLVRRTPVRVTLNPWYWLLTLVATYWVPFPVIANSPDFPIAPNWVTVVLSCLGLGLAIYARLSLGRNIGFVPAQRQLVTTGAYSLVRHPIYTAIFINYLALLLRHYSPEHLILVTMGILWFMLKSLVEERFLSADPVYAAYTRRVRRRWIPGLV